MTGDAIDPEMLSLFREESAEQLDAFEQALLTLEQDPEDEEAIDQARRQAHNLKGSARILGFSPIEELAHASEDVLDRARGDGLGQQAVDELLAVSDALRDLAESASREGVDAQAVPVDEVLAGLSSLAPGGSPRPQTGPSEPEAEEPDEDEPAEEVVDPIARARDHRIETIRVDPERLDTLLRQAGELSASLQGLDGVGEELSGCRARVEEIDRLVRNELPTDTETSVARRLRREIDQVGEVVSEAVDAIEQRRGRLEELAEAIESGIKESRLVPMANTFSLFSRAVRDLARAEGKRVDLTVEGEQVRADKQVLEELKSPLMHLVRNAVDHGIEPPEERRAAGKDPTGRLRLAARRTAETIEVEVEDDGRGIDPGRIRELARERGLRSEAELAAMDEDEVLGLVFEAGFTTRETVSEVSGRGIGLETVAKSVEQLQGSVDLVSTPGEGTHVRLELPVELSTVHVVLVCAGSHTFGIPIEAVHRALTVDREEVTSMGGQARTEVDGRSVPLADIGEVLGLRDVHRSPDEGAGACVVLREGSQLLGVLVDDVVGETEVVLEPLGPVLSDVRAVDGATVLSNGQVCIVLDPIELAEDVREGEPVTSGEPVEADTDRGRLLLVEDTQVTRRQLQRRLETGGWTVHTAANGEEALAVLDEEPVDVVVTDILMPGIDGRELTRRIRRRSELAQLPVVLISTRSVDEAAQAGLSAGADAFVTKDPVEPTRLLDTLEALA